MADIKDFEQGAKILQQVDVSDIFTSLAMGIADAQKKLDDNSIAQVAKLANQQIYGKSLLELGFIPAFYSFTYADISASINLKMALKSSFDLGIKIGADYNSGKTNKDDYRNIKNEKDHESSKKEFESSKRFIVKNDYLGEIKINESTYKLDAISNTNHVLRINKFHSEVLAGGQADRLTVAIREPFKTEFTPTTTFTVLRITDYSGDHDATSPIIEIAGNFASVFPSGGKYGFTKNKIYGLPAGVKPFELYFDFDKRVLDFTYAMGNYKNNDGRLAAFGAFADILRLDPGLKITIKGYTDGSGKNSYNLKLSDDRCNALKSWFKDQGARDNQITCNGLGESLAGADQKPNPEFRKVVVELEDGKDYIWFDATWTTANPNPVPTIDPLLPNYFIKAGAATTIISESYFGAITETNTEIKYTLEENAQIEFFAYSKESNEIIIKSSEEAGEQKEVIVGQKESSSDELTNYGSNNDSNKTLALSGSVDFRMSKQFEMSMEGNSSMSARMVASPPPAAFIDFINNTLNPE